MSTNVYVNTYTHTVAYVTDKMLHSLERIILWSGLDPKKLTREWAVLERGIKTWLQSKDLLRLILEVYHPYSGALVGRWDFEIEYSYGSNSDGSMWVDTENIKTAIKKVGLNPASCDYDIIASTKLGRPSVDGWGTAALRSTE